MINFIYDDVTATLEIDTNATPVPYDDDQMGIDGEYGFTYNGIHSSEYRVYYIPDASDRWFEGPEWEMYQTDVAWKNGGYFYGSAAKIRKFTLKCFYEEVNLKTRENIRKWLHRSTSGRLMFDDMPFVYWNVRPSKIVQGNRYIDGDFYSGTFTLELTAYEPFGYLTRKYNTEETVPDGADRYCDLIDISEMPAIPTRTSQTFQVYNPGREECGMTIRIAGTSDNPIEILNETNKTRCIIGELPTGGAYLEINGDTGKVLVKVSADATGGDNGYAYHDRGFVKLAPGLNDIRIMEQNENGNWGSWSTVSLSDISIDYQPRVL